MGQISSISMPTPDILGLDACTSIGSLNKQDEMALDLQKATVQAALDETVGALKRCALISKVQTGDSLTLLCSNTVQVQASGSDFAAILDDGAVVTWPAGSPGDSTDVPTQLKIVQQISVCGDGAFAAILDDGSVVTWGGDENIYRQPKNMKNVQQIQASHLAFSAILDNGSVVTWGARNYGGDCRAAQGRLENVQHIQASHRAFAAILDDGSVVTWGSAAFGADSSAVRTQLKNVQQIQASRAAFAAILDDGSVVTWGHAEFGADSSAVQTQLKNVQQIQASEHAFAAILDDGSVVTWGNDFFGADSSAVQSQLKNVQQIQASHRAFAAILGDGFVVTWGDADFGADSSTVQTQLKTSRFKLLTRLLLPYSKTDLNTLPSGSNSPDAIDTIAALLEENASKSVPLPLFNAWAALADQAVRVGIDYRTLGLGWSHPNTRRQYRLGQHASISCPESRARAEQSRSFLHDVLMEALNKEAAYGAASMQSRLEEALAVAFVHEIGAPLDLKAEICQLATL
ncbi:hypothetical protein AK812_SmicGene18789 [Symbiodinium microadriaticum]|uniref:E3 ubiquitin-protein ligase HERC2 n=1 Tax=Symbiodinium microadriaticum TaxID=2951 RepID=A0A1Q9DUC6_SYMMI|nr:hypothetical protein AK812_SmicGene18789 [Symbiodinium microadriaticum]